MRLLVCGSRDWRDREYLYEVLDYVHAALPVSVLIEGGARGADSMARDWARLNSIPVEEYPADWKTHGRSAGPIRNREMLMLGNPKGVIAFTEDLAASRGTRDMVSVARKAGVKTIVLPEEEANTLG